MFQLLVKENTTLVDCVQSWQGSTIKQAIGSRAIDSNAELIGIHLTAAGMAELNAVLFSRMHAKM